jgi:hypothetical protein
MSFVCNELVRAKQVLWTVNLFGPSRFMMSTKDSSFGISEHSHGSLRAPQFSGTNPAPPLYLTFSTAFGFD